ncbi:MAG: hypothetical protein JRG92_10390 [Deltaproteobacteria bacterium]|nr:hypothetical protein [Deltaproteobacteria bacterium]
MPKEPAHHEHHVAFAMVLHQVRHDAVHRVEARRRHTALAEGRDQLQ